MNYVRNRAEMPVLITEEVDDTYTTICIGSHSGYEFVRIDHSDTGVLMDEEGNSVWNPFEEDGSSVRILLKKKQ